MALFQLGLIINPYAGIGGPLGYKGSDGAIIRRALEAGAERRAVDRTRRALQALQPLRDSILISGFSGEMGGDAAAALGFEFEAAGRPAAEPSSADDTVAAARSLRERGVDLVLFAGGDGTARDIYRAIGDSLPVLGLPAGVKMHSGVYAVSPESAAAIVSALVRGELVDIGREEVRDIDEEAFRQDRVRSRHYGELLVPRLGQFLQHVKSGGRESEELVLADIAAEFLEIMDEEALYIIGPGTTTRAVMEELGLPNTLLGVDAVRGGELLGSDLAADDLLRLLDEHGGPAYIVVTAIGGQGHILGRGNQQLSPAVIRKVGLDHLMVLATKTKITELAGRPLLVDTDDAELDRALEGYIPVITGYRDAVMYRVSAGG